jgi:hypothetical protein
MKKLIIILIIAFSFSSCAILKAQQEADEQLAKQEKYEFTRYVCSIYDDFHNNCDKHLKNKEDFRVCNDKSYELHRVLFYYEEMYGIRFNFKLCKQFINKKTVKKSNKKVNKKK